MRARNIAFLVPAIVITGWSSIACGQTTNTDSTSLAEGARVRLVEGSETLSGWLIRAGSDSVVTETDAGDILAVTPMSISTLQVRTGRHGHAWKGAAIGAGVGLVVGLFAVIVDTKANDDDDTRYLHSGWDSNDDTWYALGVGATTGAGALLGAGIGGLIRTDVWTPVSPPWKTSAIQRPPQGFQVGLALSFPIDEARGHP